MVVIEYLGKTERDGEITYNYIYRLIKNDICLSKEQDGIVVQAYGIEIERQDMLEGKIQSIERDCVEVVSPHRHKVHSLLRLLYENTVSPLHLVEVVGEYVDEYVNDFDSVFADIAME